jgi:hypothetical protein
MRKIKSRRMAKSKAQRGRKHFGGGGGRKNRSHDSEI